MTCPDSSDRSSPFRVRGSLVLAGMLACASLGLPGTTRPAGAAPATPAASPATLRLGGTWILDPDRSDDPLEKMRSARGGGPGPGAGPGGFGGRGGGRRGGRPPGGEGGWGGPRGEGGAEGDDARRGGMRAALADFAPADTLVIRGDVERLVLDGGRRGAREIHTVPRPVSAVGTAPAVAWPGRWEKDELVVEREGPNDSIVRERYVLADQGRRLEIHTRIEPRGEPGAAGGGDGPGGARRGMPAFEFKRVYGRAGGGPARR